MNNTSHLILIGFTHVGKTVVGSALARELGCSFYDLDREIERHLKTPGPKRLVCRNIMQDLGELGFREMEAHVLERIVRRDSAVIALGGGAPVWPQTRALLHGHRLIHLTAERDLVWARLSPGGIPAFFPSDLPPRQAFDALWDARWPIYRSLVSDAPIDNSGLLSETLKVCVGGHRREANVNHSPSRGE